MLAHPPPLFPPAPSFLSPLPVQLGSSSLGELYLRSNHPKTPSPCPTGGLGGYSHGSSNFPDSLQSAWRGSAAATKSVRSIAISMVHLRSKRFTVQAAMYPALSVTRRLKKWAGPRT